MTNFQIYRKVLSFSLLIFLIDLLAIVLIFGLAAAGFFIMYRSIEWAFVGLAVGLLLGIIAASLINIFVTNRVKAAQIAIMVKGISEGALPDRAFKAGFEEIRGRFGKITVFFFITNAIKGIFRQIGRGINRIGTAVGGDTGNAITSAIDSAIQTLIGYLCDCCLGWVLYRKDINSFRAGCEGTVIFFKHGKTLFRNIGRIFGMGLLSFIVVGGGLFALSFLVFNAVPGMFETMASGIAGSDPDAAEFLTNPTTFMIIVSIVLAVILWSTLHSVLVRPFILVGVMRNFMAAGQKDMPAEADFQEIGNKYPKFNKLYSKI